MVKLLQSDYVSLSEARRLLANLEKFQEIVLDFRDVRSVGQGFADAEWQQGGFPIPAKSTMRDVFHLILSMPTRTNPLAAQRAARALATREYSNH